MAFILLRLLVLGVIAAAADDVQITWLSQARGVLPCVVADAGRMQRRPPPPLEADERPRLKPYRRRGDDDGSKRLGADGVVEVSRKRNGTEGVYQCLARHHAGHVLGYPVHWKFASMDKQFSKQPENSTVRAGEPFALSCVIPSGPPAMVSWLKNGESLPRNNDRYIFLETQLLFTEVRKEDSGVYKCIATNSYLNKTRMSHGGWLKVEDPVDTEPAILPILDPVNITAPRFSRVKLLCPAQGWPRPRITWEITPFDSRTATHENTEEILELTSLELDQEGIYKCSIDGYSHLSKVFNVTVTEPVAITLPPISKEVIRASTVRFNCTATGRPEPTITWFKDGQLLELGFGRFNLRSSTYGNHYELVVGGVTSKDAGIYQCFASNGISSASSWAVLGVTGASAAAPASVRCWPLAAHAILLRWESPSANVMAYTVQTTVPAWSGKPHTDTEETITVSQPLTTYGFQVRAYVRGAVNVASDMSEAVYCQGQGVPVHITQQTEDTVMVSWKNFAEVTPNVVQWILQYRSENSTVEQNVTLPGETLNYTLHASPKNPLQIRVLGSKYENWLPQNLTYLAWTSTNGPDNAREVNVIPEDLRLIEAWSREFTIGWRCEGGETYSFQVCARKPDGTKKCIESYNNSATVDGLEPGTDYEVKVRAQRPGNDEPGPSSRSLFVTTTSDGPERFKQSTEVTVKFVNTTTVRVSWNAAPAKFTVRYSNHLDVPVEQWDAVDTIGNTVLITGVDPTKNTYVMVTGHDPPAYSSIKTIPAQVPFNLVPGPERLKELTWQFLNSTTVQLTWYAPPAKYTVMYSTRQNEPMDTWKTIDTFENTVVISGVDPKKDLFVMVTGPDSVVYSSVKTIPAQVPEVQWWWTARGVGVRWRSGSRVLLYSQNLTTSLDLWPVLNVTGTSVELTNLDPALRTYVMVMAPGPGHQNQVFNIPMRPVENSSLYLGLGIAGGLFIICVVAIAAFCIWRRRKRAGSPLRFRRRNVAGNEEDDEEAAELKNVGGRLANGGGSKDAGEPLLNGHVHITENPQSKAPNGKMKKAVLPFDLARYEDPDTTLETVLDDSAAYDSAAFELLDTSRRSEQEPDNSFSKLPDDNMNSELNRTAHFQLENSKFQPTLQPNG